MNNTTFGRIGEEAAAKYLQKKGYRILAENYSAGGGELDIVAYHKKTLVFVEVKTRSGNLFGSPAQAVDEKKIALLHSAGNAFIKEQCPSGRVPVFYPFNITVSRKYKRVRYDIVEVFLKRRAQTPDKINHIQNILT